MRAPWQKTSDMSVSGTSLCAVPAAGSSFKSSIWRGFQEEGEGGLELSSEPTVQRGDVLFSPVLSATSNKSFKTLQLLSFAGSPLAPSVSLDPNIHYSLHSGLKVLILWLFCHEFSMSWFQVLCSCPPSPSLLSKELSLSKYPNDPVTD